jgi:hypothetical protein
MDRIGVRELRQNASRYLALVKREEHETVALGEWLNARPDQAVVTSELGRIEVLRAARRVGGQVQTEARAVVGDLDLLPLDRAVHDLACEIAHPLLRTLGALHLASAVLLGEELTAFVAYDHRLAAAAAAAGLIVDTPGR